MNNQTKNIVFFDLETTGTDICKDRIVQIAAQKFEVSGAGKLYPVSDMKVHLINPEMQIPPGATKVHGITNERVAHAPTFAQMAVSIGEFFQHCDLAGFNIVSFDIPLLAEEFLRVNRLFEFPVYGAKVFDAYKIFSHYERRDLTGAAKFYLNAEHEGAHDAGADVTMTVDVLAAQLQKYGLTDAEALHTLSVGEGAVDYAGKLHRNEAGEICYSFGKSKGKPVTSDPGFGIWMLNQSFPAQTKQIIRDLLKTS